MVNHFRYSCFAQNRQHCFLCLQPDLVSSTFGVTVAGLAGCNADIERNRTVHDLDDVKQGCLSTEGKKRESAIYASPGLDQSCTSKRLEDFGEKRVRRFGRPGKHGFGNDGSFGLAGQMNDYANGIVGGTGQLHNKN